MTERDAPPPADPDPAPTSDVSEARGIPADGICPYLRAAGAWRSTAPSREHRCAAVSPPARLVPEKQARLCLTPTHPSCATFAAALEARRALPGPEPALEPGGPTDPAYRPLARTIVTVTETARPPLLLRLVAGLHRGGQALVGVLMVVALIAVVVARLEPGSGAAATPGPSATAPVPTDTASASAAATPTPVPTPTPTPRPTPRPTPTATPPPTAAPTPAATNFVRYTVKEGDTLFAIAVRFNTTVAAIADANNITNTAYVRVGDVLLIPQ